MLQLLKSRLDANIKRLDTLEVSAHDDVSDEKKEQELLLMAEAQRDMFNLELKNLSTGARWSSSLAGGDDIACSMIQKQMDSSDERNLTSAMASLERAMTQCDTAIVQKIEASAEAIEAIIPALEVKISDRKLEIAEALDSSKLLTATVENNYQTMRDGYLLLLKKVFEESRVQWKALLHLHEPNRKWHLEKLQKVIEDAQNSPELEERRAQIYQDAQQQLDHFCDASFQRIRDSNMYEEKERYLEQITAARRKIFEHRAQLVREKEGILNHAEALMDQEYLGPLEDLTQHLLELQNLQYQLVLHEQRLTQQLVVALKREVKMDQLCRSAAEDVHSYSQDSQAMVALVQQTQEELQACFRMGTVLRGLAEGCDLPQGDTERLLEHVLFADSVDSHSTSHL